MSSMTVDELLEEFSDCSDRERQQLIIEFGRKLAPLPDRFKNDNNRVLGCQNNVWLISQVSPDNSGRMRFLAFSDGQISRGLVAILLSLVEYKTPAEILAMDLDAVFKQLHLSRYVSHRRTGGLEAMIKRVRNLARHHLDSA